MVEHLPGMLEALSGISSTTTTTTNKNVEQKKNSGDNYDKIKRRVHICLVLYVWNMAIVKYLTVLFMYGSNTTSSLGYINFLRCSPQWL